MTSSINETPEVERFIIEDDGQFPNSSLFILIYKNVFQNESSADAIKKTFENNNWKNSWVNGIYDYHHYHSNTHEVIAISSGNVKVLLGGAGGKENALSKGDVLIIPAGVAHKCITASEDFECVGAYPNGVSWDLKKGEDGERPEADENISAVALPDNDPVYGAEGPLALNWKVQ